MVQLGQINSGPTLAVRHGKPLGARHQTASVHGPLNHNPLMSLRMSVLLVWALVAASAVFWSLKLFATGAPVPANASVAATAPTLNADLTRLLGADAAPEVQARAEPVTDDRFKLVGVLNPRGDRHAREGIALIAVDGKPARSFRVGAVVDGDRVLQSVNLRGATLGPRGAQAQITLNIPPPADANRGRPVFAGFAPATTPSPSPSPQLQQAPVLRQPLNIVEPAPEAESPPVNINNNRLMQQ